MGRALLLTVPLSALLVAVGAGHAEDPAETKVVALQCLPTATWSYLPPGATAPIPGPQLAVVDTDVSPGHARLYLDGRFIGLADDFDGYPDFLYLRPGRYRLECRLGGYLTDSFTLEARPGCSFELRHHLRRVSGSVKEHWWEPPTEVAAGGRVFGPVEAVKAAGGPPPGHGAGPDLSLRPDLTRRTGGPLRSGVRLSVTPSSAAVYLDGAFAGTGNDLATSPRPLAAATGAHSLEIVAPGYRSFRQQLELEQGQVLELQVALERETETNP